MRTSAWRLTKTKFAHDPLSAEGARLYGGRWNSPGVSVVYFAESISLAVLDVLVHLQTTRVLSSYSLIRIDFETSAIRTMGAGVLPPTWADSPAPADLQTLGNAWVKSLDSALLKLPSAIVPLEHLFLLNPTHPGCSQVTVSEPMPFRLDPRLLP